MKKAILCLTILAALCVPFSAFGMEMLNDSAMDNVTGQAGVSIAFDDLQLFLNVEKFAYIDTDGFSTNSNYGGTDASDIGGGFVIENFQMDEININMIGAAGKLALFYEGKDLNGATAQAQVVQYYPAAAGLNDDHIAADGVAYGLSFVEGSTTYYRNPGHQTVFLYDSTNTDGYKDLGWNTTHVYNGYQGSLPLASASAGSIPLFYDYGTTAAGTSFGLKNTDPNAKTYTMGLDNYVNTNNVNHSATFHPQAITIDVTGELPLHTAGLAKAMDPGSNVTIGGVLIGLPTAEIHIQQMNIGKIKFTADIYGDNCSNQDIATTWNPATGTYVSLGVTNASLVKNNNDSFGAVMIEGITFTTLGGWMEIAPTHGAVAGD